MTIMCLSLSHRSAPAGVLEKLAVPARDLAALEAGCSAPVGALAEVAGQTGAEPAVRLSGLIAAPDGSSVIRAQMTGAVGDSDALGRQLAYILLEHGGAELLDRASHGVSTFASHGRGGVVPAGA